MSKFGEPWKAVETEDGTNIHDKNNEHVYFEGIYDSGFNMPETNIPRTVACVNALDGVENPEAVKELLDTVRLLQSFPKDDKEALSMVKLSVIFAMAEIQFTEDEQCEK